MLDWRFGFFFDYYLILKKTNKQHPNISVLSFNDNSSISNICQIYHIYCCFLRPNEVLLFFDRCLSLSEA